jgi:hypothetical protein
MSASSSITFTTGGVVVKPRIGAAMICAAFAGVEAPDARSTGAILEVTAGETLVELS